MRCSYCGMNDDAQVRSGYCLHCEQDSNSTHGQPVPAGLLQPSPIKEEEAQKPPLGEDGVQGDWLPGQPHQRGHSSGMTFWLIAIVLVIVVVWCLRQKAILDHMNDPKAAVKELALLQGSWVALSQVRFGENVSKDRMNQLEFEFVKDQLRMKTRSGEFCADQVKLDLSTSRKKIDLVSASGLGTRQGIFELRGDRLTICYSLRVDGDRPARFESGEDTLHLLIVFQRK